MNEKFTCIIPMLEESLSFLDLELHRVVSQHCGSWEPQQVLCKMASALNCCAIFLASLSLLADKENSVGNLMLLYNFVLSW